PMMAWRDPKNPEDRIVATCETLYELALAYHPILRFADAERVFPILAESWLTHTTGAPWTAADAEADDVPPDPFCRGTTIVRSDIDVSNLTILGGAPNADDRPIQLSSLSGDRDAIGNYDTVGADVFLNFGGWQPDGTRLLGDA